MEMFSALVKVQETPQKSFNIVFFDKYPVIYEVLLLSIAVITAFAAIRTLRASRRQNELSTVPHLFFEAEGKVGERRLVLTSSNSMLAYDFHIDELYRFMSSEKSKDAQVSKYVFKFDLIRNTDGRRNFLSKKGGKIPVKVYQDEEELDTDFAGWLFTSYVKVTQFRVRFTDSQNLKYFTDIVFDEEGVSRIKHAPRRLTLGRRFFISLQSGLYRVVILWWRVKIAYHRLFS